MNDYGIIPFWSWNGDLEKEKLNNQLQNMKKYGFGGFFIHARGGLTVEYMSDKWFELVGFCIDKAREYGLKVWIYDENGWPSGFADEKLLREKYFISHLSFAENCKFDSDALANYRLINGKYILCDRDDGGRYSSVKRIVNKTYVDLMNPNVAKDFVKETHEKYKAKFGRDFVGFFTDEPQYSRDGIPWSSYLKKEYESRYGKKILDDLIYLFVEEGDYSRKIRYDFYSLANELFLTFQKYVYNWCERNGYLVTGHTIDETNLFGQIACCGGVMPFYEYEHIPGIDWLTREKLVNQSAKQCSSVAEQLGKRKVLTETFGASGWNTSVSELKKIVDYQMVKGVNLVCYHLYPYSIAGERKHDFPPFFGESCKWMDYSFKFNDYIVKTGKLLGEGEKRYKVLLIHPLTSAYLDFKRYDPSTLSETERNFKNATDFLDFNQVQYHLGDEKIIKKYGKVCGTKLCVGKAEYEYIVVPELKNLNEFTYGLIKEFSEAGGKILFMGAKPAYKEGLPFVCDLQSTCSSEDVTATAEFKLSYGRDFLVCQSDYKDKKVVFVLNCGTNRVKQYIDTGYSCYGLDLINDTKYGLLKNGDKYVAEFAPSESKVFVLGDGERPFVEIQSRKREIDMLFTLESAENYLPVDVFEYSLNGVDYEKEINVVSLKKKLLDIRFDGRLYLRFRFNTKGVIGKVSLVVEKGKDMRVKINGEKVAVDLHNKYIDNAMQTFDISDKVRQGDNTVEISLRYFQSEKVYYVLYTDGISETLKNKLVYDTEIDAAYLVGEFEVDFIETEEDDAVYRIADFALKEQRKNIDVSDLAKQGYPFKVNDMVVKKSVGKTKGRFSAEFNLQAIDVWLNNKEKGVLYGFNDLPIEARKDNNELKLTLSMNMRNLFGPFHNKEGDLSTVCPDTFDKIDRTDYAVVKQGISKIYFTEKDEGEKNIEAKKSVYP